MAIAETAARKLLQGGAIARGVADVGGISFAPWDLVTGFFANILSYLFAALAGLAHLLVMPLELLWQGLVTVVATAAGAISSGLDALWQHVTGFFAGIFSALASVPHLLVLPLEALWHWLATAAADAAGAIASGLDGLWQHVTGFFAGMFAGLAGAAHQLVLPLETLWQWLVAAAGSISSGLDGLWQLVTGFIPGILAHLSAALAGAAHEIAKQLESLWEWLLANVSDAAGAISFRLDGLWQLVAGFFPKLFAHILAALAGAAHEIPHKLDEFWRWVKAAAIVAFPVVLGVAVVVLLVALLRYWGPALCAVGVGACALTASVGGALSCLLTPCAQCLHLHVAMSALSAVAVGACQALVCAVFYVGNGLFYVAASVGGALSCLLPPCTQCLHLHVVTMSAVAVGGCQALVNAFSYLHIRRAAPWPAPTMTASPSPSAFAPNEATAASPCRALLPPPRPASQPPAVLNAMSLPAPTMMASPSPSAVAPNEAAAASPVPAPPPGAASQPPAVAAEEGEQNDRKWSAGAESPREEDLELLVEDDTESVIADCCCVCMEQAKDAALDPCGHTFCRDCGRKLVADRGLCPLCNTAIDKVLDIF